MLILKNFFRKKITKIYLCIFSILFLILIVINSLTGYLKSTKNSIFTDVSYLIVTSKTDYLSKLQKEKEIKDVEECYFADIKSDLIKARSSIAYDSNGNYLYESSDGYTGGIALDDLKLSSYNHGMIVVDKLNKYNLQDNEVLLGTTELAFEYYSDSINNLKGKDIKLSINNIDYDYVIKDFYLSNIPFMIVSSSSLDKIEKDGSIYLYRAKPNSEKEANALRRKLEKDKDVTEVTVEAFYNETNSRDLENVSKILDIIQIIEIIFTIIIGVVLVIMMKSLKKDWQHDLKIIQNIGLNLNHTKSILALLIAILFIISLILSILFSIAIIFLINFFFKISLNYINYSFLFIIIIFILILDGIFWAIANCD